MKQPLLLALAVLAAGCGRGGERAREFPSAPVVLFSIDTLRADHLPAYGYTRVETPSIDALRRDAILFENAYSQVPLTLPSHLSMLTGLLPAEHGVRTNLGYRFDGAAHPTLARILRHRGYATGAAVSSYVLRGATGISDAWDLYDDEVGPDVAWTPDVSLLKRPGVETVRRALAWLGGVKGKPFFLFVHVYEPHLPYEPPEPFRSRYGATYDAEVAAADAAFGELVAQLKHDSLYDRAIVLLVSDHGEGLGDHGEQEHGILLYREVLHVPLLLKLPGSRGGGSRVAAPVALTDVAPTIASLLKLEGGLMKGLSLLDRDRAGGGASGVYSETYYPRIHFGWSALRSLTDARYQYIDGPKPELYDVVRDSREATALADAGIAQAMKRGLSGFPTEFVRPGRVDPDVAERLKALGYVSDSVPTRDDEVLPNPRDRIEIHDRLKEANRLAAQGRNAEALTAQRDVVAREPASFEARRDLAGTLARLGRFAEAAAEYEEAMKLSPRLAPSVALPLGLVDLQMGRLRAAETRAKAALAEDPGRAQQLLARIAMARGDLATAESRARDAMADPAAGAEGAMLLAQVHVQRSELPQALAVVEQARARVLERGGPLPTGLEPLRADVLARLGRFLEAEAVLRQEIRAFPGRAQSYATLAVVLALEGRPRAEVRETLETMARAAPGPSTLLLGAQTLEFLGDKAAARDWRRRAVASK